MTREEKVLVFQDRMLQEVNSDPKLTPLKDRQLAIKLIFEELKETAIALGVAETFSELCYSSFHELDTVVDDITGETVDPVEVADGFADIEYTCLWGVNTTGLTKVYDKVFDEVCSSNNSKDCETIDQAEATKAKYEAEGFTCEIKENKFGRFVVIDQHGKVKKSINYSPANIEQYVTK